MSATSTEEGVPPSSVRRRGAPLLVALLALGWLAVAFGSRETVIAPLAVEAAPQLPAPPRAPRQAVAIGPSVGSADAGTRRIGNARAHDFGGVAGRAASALASGEPVA